MLEEVACYMENSRKRKLDGKMDVEKKPMNENLTLPPLLKYAEQRYTCRYCGILEFGRRMTKVPGKEDILMKWAERLGEEFLQNVRNNKTNKICWSHFKHRDNYRNPYNLPMNYVDIDQESDSTESNDVAKPKSSKSKEEILKKCCVCGEMNQKYQMTLAPKQKKILVKWAQVFGPQIIITGRKDQTNQYICAIHWKQLRDDWEGPLPEVLEKMKKENNGSFEVVMFLNDVVEGNAQKREVKSICRYCEISCNRNDMTSVPKNEFYLSQWANILGPRFLENVKSNKENKICWSHFKYRNPKLRNVENHPMNDVKLEIEANNEVTLVLKDEELEKMKNEQKPDFEMLMKMEIKMDSTISIPDQTYSTHIVPENENKPLNIIMEKQ